MACGGSCGCDDCGKKARGAVSDALSPAGVKSSAYGCGCDGTREPPSHMIRGAPEGAVAAATLEGAPADARRGRGAAATLADTPDRGPRVPLARVSGAFESLAGDAIATAARVSAEAERPTRL